MGFIGAGLLEDFLSAHASAYINAIEATAAVNPRFRQALACCWIWNDVPDATFERLAQAAGADLDRPRSPEEAHARRQRDARFRELAERVDRLSDPDNLSADPNELDEALRELNGLLGVEPHDE